MKRLCVAGIIIDTHRLLMGRRGKDPNRGLYVLPGGGVNDGETLEEALRREIMEETGLEIDYNPARWEHPYVIELEDRIILVGLVTSEINTPKDGSDLYDVQWFESHKLPSDISPVIVGALKHHGFSPEKVTNTLDHPRTINPAQIFDALVQWFYNELIIQKGAPGFIVGLSGTDSLVTFCAASKALEKVGKADRILGVHFAPSEDFLYDNPEAEAHLWFRDQILPWLRGFAPQANIVVDTSIDWRCDGQRWGYLMDLSVVSNDKRRVMRLPEDQYWVVGTRNRTEDVLLNYSNASMAVSLQPIIHLWKSKILQISEHIGVPQLAITKSCETDCICGRLALPSRHIKEVDMLLMSRCGELSEEFELLSSLRFQLNKFIDEQMIKNKFKKNIPYIPDPLVFGFESGILNLKEFNHRKHLEIAWHYLKNMNYEAAVERYVYYLMPLLDVSGQSHRFSLPITQAYFTRLNNAIEQYPTDSFDDLVIKLPSVLSKIPA